MNALTAGNERRALTEALTKIDMNPRPMPCFFSKLSLYLLRRSMTAVMSHSLNVVSIAAVCWASTRRAAMRWRSGDMRSRRVPREPGCAGGGVATGLGARGAESAAAGAAEGEGVLAVCT